MARYTYQKRGYDIELDTEAGCKKPYWNEQHKGRADFIFHILTKYPDHINAFIFSLLSRVDLINLASTSCQNRALCSPVVFSCIKVSWEDLDNHYIHRITNIHHQLPIPLTFLKNVRITNVSLQHEWSFPINLLVEARSLEMATSKSTNFFKYFPEENAAITVLKIRGDGESVCNTFNLEHLIKLPNLQELFLENYYIEYFEFCDSFPTLTNLVLINCAWAFPFDVSNFFPSDENSEEENTFVERKITFVYRANHFMLLSERFNSFINKTNSPRRSRIIFDVRIV